MSLCLLSAFSRQPNWTPFVQILLRSIRRQWQWCECVLINWRLLLFANSSYSSSSSATVAANTLVWCSTFPNKTAAFVPSTKFYKNESILSFDRQILDNKEKVDWNSGATELASRVSSEYKTTKTIITVTAPTTFSVNQINSKAMKQYF